jgi:C4-dicarboxylate-specific signal transduction histidine kinase
VVTAALLTGAGYYLASLLGLALRLPGSTPSVLWPPNAVLTAALLLTPVEWWSFCLLAALPGHLLVQLPTGWPFPMIAVLFITNCTEAIVGASVARTLARGPLRLETLRGLAAFGVGVVLAGPLVSNYPDAAIVHWYQGEGFWNVWVQRFSSNTLTELIVVPAVLGIVDLIRRGHRWSPGRIAEVLLILAGLVCTGWLTFADVPRLPAVRVLTSEAPFALYLPFLLWAAIRFGVGGAGVALFVSTEFTVYAVVHGHGPFRATALSGTVLPLQLSLALITSTLLVLATLVAERRRALRALTDRYRVERLLARIAAAFVHVRYDELQSAFDEALARVGATFTLSAAALLEVRPDGGWNVVSHWTSIARERDDWARAASHATWLHASLSRGETAFASAGDRELDALASVTGVSVGSLLALPVSPAGQVVGGLVVVRGSAGPWRPVVEGNLKLICDILGNALARTQAEGLLRRAELESQQQRRELAFVTRRATLGELATSLAHQLNQPLMTIAANVAVARRLLEAGGDDRSDLHAIVEDVGEANRRASDVIRRVRELLRKELPRRVDVDLHGEIRSIVQLLRSEAASRRVAIVTRLPAEPLVVNADTMQLQQVILNLVLNGLEAIGDDRPVRTVVVSGRRREDGWVDLSVEDSGSGFTSDVEALMFEPFFTTKPTGLGMGLPIVHSIVEEHGGTIRAAIAPKGGAVFTVSLPAAVPAPAAALTLAVPALPTARPSAPVRPPT